ncbi:condensation domain-containing protein [Streptomyces europaeiscabiei]|uniref:condensation domain-containing protein n=1 Tax=Streptomyces europaeiscabiei TaxID=146819 RepID=UPI002E1092A5|nr:condensation domain-containing protein [Streptomyces europaeiscabiei]
MPTSRVVIRFHGHRDTSSSLTWAQRYFWDLIAATPMDKKANVNVPLHVQVPSGTSLKTVLDAISHLLSKHESLRTTYRVDDSGEPVQVLHAKGDIAVSLVEVRSELSVAIHAVTDSMRAGEIDLTRDLPLRISVITKDSVPAFVALVISHITIDGVAMGVLHSDLTRYMSNGCQEPPASKIGRQPVDQSRHESSAAVKARAMKSLEYQRQQIVHFPNSMFDGCAGQVEEPRYMRATLTVPTLARSAGWLARRYRVTPPAVILAAYTIAVCYRTGRDECSFMLYSANRWDVQIRESVGPFAQISAMRVRGDADSFKEMARRAHRAAMSAYANGAYPTQQFDLALNDISRARGGRILLDAVVDIVDIRGNGLPAEELSESVLAEMESAGSFSVLERMNEAHQALWLKVHPDELHAVADTAAFSRDQLECLLRGMQTILINVLISEDVSLQRLREVNFPLLVQN